MMSARGLIDGGVFELDALRSPLGFQAEPCEGFPAFSRPLARPHRAGAQGQLEGGGAEGVGEEAVPADRLKD